MSLMSLLLLGIPVAGCFLFPLETPTGMKRARVSRVRRVSIACVTRGRRAERVCRGLNQANQRCPMSHVSDLRSAQP